MDENLFFFKLAITGQFRRGKDTLADVVTEMFAEHTRSLVQRLAFADALKDEHSSMVRHWLMSGEANNWVLPGLYPEAVREVSVPNWYRWMRDNRQVNGVGWQWWGEFCRQMFSEDYWVNHPALQYKYSQCALHKWPMIITDMRHHNEAQWCKEMGFFRVRVEGPCRAPEDIRDKDHPSERHIPDLEVDCIYFNDGSLDDMRKWARLHLLPHLREVQT